MDSDGKRYTCGQLIVSFFGQKRISSDRSAAVLKQESPYSDEPKSPLLTEDGKKTGFCNVMFVVQNLHHLNPYDRSHALYSQIISYIRNVTMLIYTEDFLCIEI